MKRKSKGKLPKQKIPRSPSDQVVSLTIKEQFYPNLAAGVTGGNWNFRATSADSNAGSFSVYGAANSVLIRNLGQMYELVSFPQLTVSYAPAFEQAVSTSSYGGSESAVSTNYVLTGGNHLFDFQQFTQHSQAQGFSVTLSPSSMMRDQGNPHKLLTGNASIGVLNYANSPSIMIYVDGPSPALAVTVDVGVISVKSIYRFERRIA